MFLILLSLSALTASAESYVTPEKIITSLKGLEKLGAVVRCSLTDKDNLCAFIHGGLEKSDEFRVYSYNEDPRHSPKLLYSFVPGKYNAQSFLGSFSKDGILETKWSPVGIHPKVSEISIKIQWIGSKFVLKVK